MLSIVKTDLDGYIDNLKNYSLSVTKLTVKGKDPRKKAVYVSPQPLFPGIPVHSWYPILESDFRSWTGLKEHEKFDDGQILDCNPDYIPATRANESGIYALLETRIVLQEQEEKRRLSFMKKK